ncbi:MAG: N-acetylmuramoyl-L-alanine amidase [Oscillospiraceae bacterium]|nr:N-acetylmuramoyl-L-alanine amidase [Oscillospiraceae bacterium]
MKLRKIGVQLLTYFLVLGGFTAITYWGSQAVSVVAQMIPLEREHTIVIDAGHGGEDGGATSCTGKLESAFNLEIALKLDDLLHLLGYDTRMIRTTDRSVYTEGDTISAKKVSDLKNRVKTVNETENAVLVSIHQNTFSDSRYSGAQVFYGPEGESKALAEQLQSAFCQTLNPGSSRKSKKADSVYLMQHIDCTGVLVECGFLSNQEEEAMLRSREYQQKLCCVIAATVAGFLGNANT